MQIGFIEYLVIGVYFALMIILGMIFKRFSSNLSDYIRAGGRGTWWLVGMSVFMAGFSGLTFTGISGQSFVAGWSVLIIFWVNALGFFIQAAFLAPWFRQTRADTPADVIRQRFGIPTEQLFVSIAVFGGVMWGSTMLLGLATFVSAIFGFELWTVLLTVGIIVGFYSVSGGSWSVMATDYIQSLILLTVTVVVALLCLDRLGGISGMLELIDQRGLTEDFAIVNDTGHQFQSEITLPEGQFSPYWIFALIVHAVIQCCSPSQSYRYLSVKDGASARKAAILAGLLMLAGSLIWFIPPMAARLLFADQVLAVDNISNQADAAYAIASRNVLPPGLIGLVVVAMFAATMSTMDGALTGSAGLLVKNLSPPLRRRLKLPALDDASQFRWAKRVNLSLAVLVVGLALALNYGLKDIGLFSIMLNISALIGGPMVAPLAASLFMRKVPPWAALAGIGTGVMAGLIILMLGWTTRMGWTEIEVLWQNKVLIISGSSLIGFVATRPFGGARMSPAYRDQVRQFFDQMHRPVDFKTEVGPGNDLRQFVLLGSIALAVGLMISLLAFVAESANQVVIVLSIAATITIIGVFMVLAGRRNTD